jgi:uncharacterized cofD-like protein
LYCARLLRNMATELARRPPRIVVIGGGTGSFTLLQALKQITPSIAAVVNMSDDGGSTGVLRDELGVLPPGDARQCLVALSESPEIRDLFSFRFGDGRLSGQSLGNIILSGLELQHGSFEKAVEVASKILRIRGRVLPVALGKHHLVMQDGSITVDGQWNIAIHTIQQPNARVYLSPASVLNPKAATAIRRANLVVVAPGALYYSLLPVFSVNGIAEVLRESKAHVVAVINLVNKPTHTKGWHVADYVHKIEEYIGTGQIDTVLYNNELISNELLKKYAAEGEYPVAIEPERFRELSARLIPAQLVDDRPYAQDVADKAIRRTLIRHDPWAVKTQIENIIANL